MRLLIFVVLYMNILTYTEDHCMYNEYSSIKKKIKKACDRHSP